LAKDIVRYQQKILFDTNKRYCLLPTKDIVCYQQKILFDTGKRHCSLSAKDIIYCKKNKI